MTRRIYVSKIDRITFNHSLVPPPINGANSAADIIFEKTHTFIASTLTYDFHISFLAFIYLNQYIVFLNARQSVGTHIRANFQTLYYLTPPTYLPRIAAGIIALCPFIIPLQKKIVFLNG